MSKKELEKYIEKIYKEANQLVREIAPYFYEEMDLKIEAKYKRPKKGLNIDYDIEYCHDWKDSSMSRIILSYFQKCKNPKDDDEITNNFGIKMKRKNAYLVSLIHEIGEAQFIKKLAEKNRIPPYWKINAAHSVAIILEKSCLDKLIEQSKGRDKEGFIKRKEARQKRIRKI